MALLDVQDLRVTFLDNGKEVVHGTSFHIGEGERFGLVGESGSGKTVTAMAVSGLIEKSKVDLQGSVLFEGRDIMHCSRKELRAIQGREIGVVFQEPMTSLDPLMRVGPQIEETLKIHTDKSPEERKKLAIQAMELVGLPEPDTSSAKYPHQLSGGQRQRAMIAAAMIIHPRLLICDEPTTALDVSVQAQILKLLRDLSEEFKVAILLISHDLRVVKNLCDRVAVMQRGHIVEQGSTESVFSAPQHEYTRKLIAAIPQRIRHE